MRCLAHLSRCVVVAGIRAVYDVKSVDGISDCSGKCANGVLMGAFGDDTIIIRYNEQLWFGLEGTAYPARDVNPTEGLIPTNAFLSAGLMTIQ